MEVNCIFTGQLLTAGSNAPSHRITKSQRRKKKKKSAEVSKEYPESRTIKVPRHSHIHVQHLPLYIHHMR